MSEDGSPSPRPIRRTLIAVARAAGLLALIVGIDSVLSLAVPRLGALPRDVIALLLGVTIFEILRPSRRPAALPAAVEAAPPQTSEEAAAELAEARAIIERLRDDSIEREAALRRDGEEMLAINEGLRREMASLGEVLASERAAAAEARMREERLREQAAAESEHLQRAAGKALEELQQMRAAADGLRTEADRERGRASDALREAGEVRRETETLRAELEQERRRVEQARQEAQSAAREHEKIRAESEREKQRADQSVRQAQDNEKFRAESLRERQRGDQFRHELQAATQENEKLRAESQRERQRADQAVRELQNALSTAASFATQRQKFDAQIAELERRLAAAVQEMEALQADRQRLRREIEETRQRAEVEKGELRLAVEAAANARLEETVNKLTSDHEAAARAQMQEMVNQLTSEHLAVLRVKVDEAVQRAAAEKAELRLALEAAANAKLEEIVNRLTREHEAAAAAMRSSHETEIGEAIVAREEARAEGRALASRNTELERQVEIARGRTLGLLQRDDELNRILESEKQERARLEEEIAALKDQVAKVPAVDEKALRESIDAEWSARLQTIVSHMAGDHEADVGKAIEEREAARAEARNLAIRITSLQTKVRQAEQEIASLRSAPPPEPPRPEPQPEPPPVAAASEEDEQRGRAEVLQIAEQAHAVIRAATSPGNVPVPAPERRSRVLFVHHDPTMRSMWRDNLDKSGFEVQTAADGLEALRVTMASKPDVVVADASMPKMGGLELCQLIKSNHETAAVKVILMTGVYTNEMPAESGGHQFEADELLRKPVKFDALKAALSNLLAAV